MLTPLFFVISSLLSWAWLSGTWLAAIVLSSIILFSRVTPWRWKITQNQFHRWGDLSSALVVLMIAYVYLVETSVNQPIFIVLKWLPVLFTSVLFAQLFSQQQKLPLGALFYSMRKRPNNSVNSIDFQLPYAALTLLSAGAANSQSNLYYVIVVVLFSGVLLVARPIQNSKIIWVILMAIAISSGYFGHRGLKRLHYWVEAQSVEWLSSWDADPFKGQTSIGDLGDLKLSDKIEFKIKADNSLLLMQTSYDIYSGQSWHTSTKDFKATNPVKNTDNSPLKQIEVIQAFDKEKILALPDGTVNILGLEGAYLQYT
ncbi:MAG: hypothetical protein GQ569_03705, partial [Methylococcaceae bacterium]|nr:hypothetical protein [Methylococcaceae bacterium]